MTIKDKIKKIKDKKEQEEHLSELLLSALKTSKEVFINLPPEVLDMISKKLDSIETGAEKNQSIDYIYKLLKENGIDADKLGGLNKDAFAKQEHSHSEFEEIKSKIDAEVDIVKGIAETKISEIDNKIEILSTDKDKKMVVLEEIIDKIKAEVSKVDKKIVEKITDDAKQKVIENNKKEVDMQGKRVINVAFPKEANDATNKGYVDGIAQRVASRGGGGIGVFIGATPPANPSIGMLWIDTSP